MDDRPMSDFSFERFLSEGRLMGSRCEDCGALFVPPRPVCPTCHCSGMEWAETKGTGKLAAFTCIAVGTPAMIEEGYDRDNPYCTGVVELDESPRVVARIEGVDTRNPESILIGTPVEARFLHCGTGADARTVLAFSPREGG